MCICVCVCVCVCVRVFFGYLCTYTYTHARAHTRVRVHICICMYIYIHMYMYMYIMYIGEFNVFNMYTICTPYITKHTHLFTLRLRNGHFSYAKWTHVFTHQTNRNVILCDAAHGNYVYNICRTCIYTIHMYSHIRRVFRIDSVRCKTRFIFLMYI